ncbi:ubiquinol-cytochrome c reductase iron-sulfur subunit [Marinilabilia salmonicolor]|uniref:Rieske-like 2Fe-2S protein n=1 Tax=Marinilabilia salmonicolor TaxID=989 RepID=A0A368V6U3_9BACT|nr:Rieske (2Fe-2S) protein [Marinilabilia salmonicolor]RCW36809.1 Rieske-like 2Fe-2S protein [Marinilabilia salmonicolor]
MKKIKINRRNFFRNLLYWSLTLQFIYIIFRLLKPGEKNTDLEKYYDAGDISFFENGKMYPFGSEQFYLHRLSDGGFLAVSSRCTHLGCTVQFNVNHNRFECPCHASAFNTNGQVLSPPANRPLDFYPIIFKNNHVLVDINHPVKRNRHESSQIKYV